MHKLILHPDCNAGPITDVRADVETTGSGCRARFRLKGDIGAIKVPVHAPMVREDDLWKTTCFEIFWQPDGGEYYRELNLSPSSKWACYDFDGFRLKSRDTPVDSISIACSAGNDELVFEASIGSEIPLPAKVALNAVIEDRHGNIQFWALAFAEGKPDFHSEVCRAISLEAAR